MTDVHAIGQLAVVRSLGRAGYYTCAMSAQPDALGLYSHFAREKIICPSYDDEGFIGWIQACVADNAIDLIIPSEGFLWAIQPVFDQLSPKLPIRPEGNFIYRYLNKYDYFRKITDSTDSLVAGNCPKIIFITRDTQRWSCFVEQELSVRTGYHFIRGLCRELELDRFLDGQNVSDIEFEAELCGMGDFLRKVCG